MKLDRLPDAHVRELHFLEIRIHPRRIERHDGHQRRAGRDARADLYASASDRAADGCVDPRALECELRIADPSCGGKYLRMRRNIGSFDLHDDRMQRLARHVQGCFELRNLIARMLQILRRDAAVARHLLAARQVGAGRRERNLALSKLCTQPFGLREQAAYLTHGPRQLGLGLGHCDFGVGGVDFDEELSALDILRVIDMDRAHLAWDLARDLHEIGGDIGIFGALVEAPVQQPIGAIRGEHQAGERGERDEAHAALGGHGSRLV